MAESERLDELISNLLILAKKESQLDDIPRTPIHINELLGNIIQNAAFEAGSKNMEIHIEKFKDFQVSSSAEILGRALENVIRNGLHYSPPKSSIEIDAREENNQLRVSIRDHGPGVPPGLAIAKQAVLMHAAALRPKM